MAQPKRRWSKARTHLKRCCKEECLKIIKR